MRLSLLIAPLLIAISTAPVHSAAAQQGEALRIGIRDDPDLLDPTFIWQVIFLSAGAPAIGDMQAQLLTRNTHAEMAVV